MARPELLSPEAAVNKAIDLINSGEIGSALQFCRDAVERNPDDVSMTALLGAALVKLREPVEAETWLRRAIELAPTFAKPYEDLGFLLLEGGRVEDAVSLLEAATRLDPRAEQAWYSLGRALAALGRGVEADEAFERSFDLNPQRKKLALAAEHHKAGRHKEAEAEYRALLLEYPDNVDAMRLLAGVLINRGVVEESEALLQRAIARAPDFALALLDLGKLLQERHRYTEAIACFEKVATLEPQSAKARFMLAAAQAPAGKTEEALTSYRQVIELRPQHAGAWLGLGHTLKTIGRQAEAIEAYRKCTRIKPDNGESYWSLANLKTYRFSDADISGMQRAVDGDVELTDQSAVNFLFALAKSHEDRGEFAAAWDYYRRANDKQRMLEHYDPVQTETTNDEIIEVFSEQLMRDKAGLGHDDPSPIFVVGLPRSGSTLIEQILASHSQVEGTSELPYLGRVASSLNRNRADGVNFPAAVRELEGPHLKALGQRYLEQAALHRHSERPRFIDKMPNNFPTAGFLRLILPNAKIIDARRYPLDSTLSCYRQLFARGQTFVYDLLDIGEYFLEYQRMMDHWHTAMPGQVLTVQYEDVVTDFDNQVARLLDFCGLPFEEACIRYYETDRPVRTASSEQVRQPVYRQSVHFWRNYEPYLGELIEVLEPVLPRYREYENINRIGGS